MRDADGRCRLKYVQWLHRGKVARDQVGGKGASLSELMAAGFSVPDGFVVTADAYRAFDRAAGVSARAAEVAEGTDFRNAASVRDLIAQISPLLVEAPLPDDIVAEVAKAYEDMCAMTGVACAVRSSAVGEDSASASFAGLYESYLNVRGVSAVLEALRRCYASLWADRALRYRALRTGSVLGEAMAVVVMGLVPSEVSGIAFTAHPVTGEADRVVINSSWGLGEAIVSGRVTPDSYVVRKGSLDLLERDIYEKELMIVSHPDGQGTLEMTPPSAKVAAPSLSDDAARAVAQLAADVERYYGRPQDVEWGMTGGELFVLQSRPITTLG